VASDAAAYARLDDLVDQALVVVVPTQIPTRRIASQVDLDFCG
jgi:hypothetical protein